MRRLLILLVALMLSVPVQAGKKVLVLRSPQTVDVATLATDFEKSYMHFHNIGGFGDHWVDPADSEGVWTAAISGDYGIAICLNLPDLDGDRNTAVELDAAGWWRLDNYISGDDSLAFPIPLLIPIPADLDTVAAGVWGASTTGQIGWNDGAFTGEDHPVTNANGDTLFLRTHAGAVTFKMPMIATNDTMSTVYPLIWHDKATTSANQVYCTLWMTSGTGNHKVIYAHTAAYSWQQGPIMALIAAFADFTEIDVALGIHYFGANSTAYSEHQIGVYTNRLAENLEELKDSVTTWGMKFEFNTDTYDWANAHSDSMREKYTDVEGWCATYPDNFRMTIQGGRTWDGLQSFMFSYNLDHTQATMEGYVAATIDSVTDHGYLSTIIDTTKISPCSTWRWQVKYDAYEAFKACIKEGITGIYVMGGADEQIGPSGGITNTMRMVHLPQNIRMRYEDEASTSQNYHNVKFHAWSRQMGNVTVGNILAGELSGEAFTDMPADSLAIESAWWLKYHLGWYYNNTDAGYDAENFGYYRPGWMMQPHFLAGDNNVLLMLTHINNYKNICNDIVQAYGTSGNTALIRYAWIDEVIHDRKLNRKWHNDHVTRASDGTGIWWK